MKFSVVIPTYNRSSYLIQALDSVLNQDYRNLEIIVIDNASSDNTEDVINAHESRDKFVYVKNQVNLGMVGSWRKALHDLINGEYFLILSDDDYLTNKSFISRAVEKINETGCRYCISKGLVKYEQDQKFVEIGLGYKDILPVYELFIDRFKNKSTFPYALCGVVFNTEFARNYGAFSNDYNLNCDSELLLASSFMYTGAYIDGINYVYRVHDSNLIHKIAKEPKLFICGFELYTSPLLYALRSGLISKDEFNGYFKVFVKPLMYRHYSKTIIVFPDYVDFYHECYSDYLNEIEDFNFRDLFIVKFMQLLPSKVILFFTKILRLIR